MLNYALAGYLYDLDVPVVATTPEVTESDGEFSPFWSEEAEAQKTEFLPWSNDRFDLEAIIAADPDLIIAGRGDRVPAQACDRCPRQAA